MNNNRDMLLYNINSKGDFTNVYHENKESYGIIEDHTILPKFLLDQAFVDSYTTKNPAIINDEKEWYNLKSDSNTASLYVDICSWKRKQRTNPYHLLNPNNNSEWNDENMSELIQTAYIDRDWSYNMSECDINHLKSNIEYHFVIQPEMWRYYEALYQNAVKITSQPNEINKTVGGDIFGVFKTNENNEEIKKDPYFTYTTNQFKQQGKGILHYAGFGFRMFQVHAHTPIHCDKIDVNYLFPTEDDLLIAKIYGDRFNGILTPLGLFIVSPSTSNFQNIQEQEDKNKYYSYSSFLVYKSYIQVILNKHKDVIMKHLKDNPNWRLMSTDPLAKEIENEMNYIRNTVLKRYWCVSINYTPWSKEAKTLPIKLNPFLYMRDGKIHEPQRINQILFRANRYLNYKFDEIEKTEFDEQRLQEACSALFLNYQCVSKNPKSLLDLIVNTFINKSPYKNSIIRHMFSSKFVSNSIDTSSFSEHELIKTIHAHLERLVAYEKDRKMVKVENDWIKQVFNELIYRSSQGNLEQMIFNAIDSLGKDRNNLAMKYCFIIWMLLPFLSLWIPVRYLSSGAYGFTILAVPMHEPDRLVVLKIVYQYDHDTTSGTYYLNSVSNEFIVAKYFDDARLGPHMILLSDIVIPQSGAHNQVVYLMESEYIPYKMLSRDLLLLNKTVNTPQGSITLGEKFVETLFTNIYKMAYEHHYVHGDIHPGNILFDIINGTDIKVFFIDTGIASISNGPDFTADDSYVLALYILYSSIFRGIGKDCTENEYIYVEKFRYLLYHNIILRLKTVVEKNNFTKRRYGKIPEYPLEPGKGFTLNEYKNSDPKLSTLEIDEISLYIGLKYYRLLNHFLSTRYKGYYSDGSKFRAHLGSGRLYTIDKNNMTHIHDGMKMFLIDRFNVAKIEENIVNWNVKFEEHYDTNFQ